MAECSSSAKTIQIQPEPTSEVHCRIVASYLVSNCTIIMHVSIISLFLSLNKSSHGNR